MEVFILFKYCYYSEEDHYSEVVRVYRSRVVSERCCNALSLANSDSSIRYFVEPFKVY